jgi:hypothetical protein
LGLYLLNWYLSLFLSEDLSNSCELLSLTHLFGRFPFLRLRV